MLKTIKKIYLFLIILVLGLVLIACKKTNKYIISNSDTQLVIKTREGKVIKRTDYVTNTVQNVELSLDFTTVKPTDVKITKAVKLGETVYEFAPLNKKINIELSDSKINVFESVKKDRNSVDLSFNYDFFDITVDGIKVNNGNTKVLEASKLNINPKNLPDNIIVAINQKEQPINKNIEHIVIEDTLVRYHLAGEETITDEEILSSQLSQLQLIPVFPDTLDNIRRSFNLPVLNNPTITTRFFFKDESSVPSEISIKDGKLVIAENYSLGDKEVILVCELRRNNIIQTKEFKLTIRPLGVIEEVNAEYLENFLLTNNYFLSFNSNENIKGISHDFYTKSPEGITLSYQVLDNTNLLSYDSSNKTFKVSNVDINTNVRIKVTITYDKTGVSASREFKITLKPSVTSFKTIEKDISIANAITISPQDLEIGGKKVTKRTVVDETIFNIVTTNKVKSKFIFNSPNNYQILYKVYYEDGTSEKVRYIYRVLPPEEISYINRYLQTLEASASEFKTLSKQANIKHTPKTIGSDNLYLPDIIYRYTGYKLNDAGTDFEKQDVDQEIDFTKKIFKIKVVDDNENEVSSGIYELHNGTKLQFIEQEDEEQVYTIRYYHLKTNELLFEEYINIRKGINAYSDYELRDYFRKLLDYEHIFLQRNIKIKERQELVKTKTLPSGIELKFRDYDNLHQRIAITTYVDKNGKEITEEKPVYDTEGNITEEHKFYQGSIYYRYFDDKGSRKSNYKPVKFNGNYYQIDASHITHCHHEESFMNMPNIQAAVFDVASPFDYALPYYKVNEIKNIQIIGNGGISGKTIQYDKEGKQFFSPLAGSLHALRTRLSRVNYDNIVTKDVNGVVWGDIAEIGISNFNSRNSFSFHLWFRNREGIINETRDIPMTRMKVKDSYFGETGGLGILLTDADSRHRLKDQPISNYVVQKEVNGKQITALNETLHKELNSKRYTYKDYNPNKLDDRINYSCDPGLEIENTKLDTWVSTSSSLVKTFNIADKLEIIQDKEELIDKLGIKVLKPEGDGSIKLNAAVVMMNNTLVDKTIAKLYNDDGGLVDNFFSVYDSPRWEVELNNDYQYYEADVQYHLSTPAFTKLKTNMFLITSPGANFLDFFNSRISESSTSSDVETTLGLHLITEINRQNNLSLNNFLQVFPLVEFPLLNSGTEYKKIYISVIIGFEKK